MSDNDSTLSRTGSFRAVVRAGSLATQYLRTGRGRPVMVLTQAGADHPLWQAVIEAVATRYRVIVPDLTVAGQDFGSWLRQFLDGLGLARVQIVADDPTAAPAIGFAILDADRVERLIVISPTGPASPGPIPADGQSLVIVRDDRPIQEIVAVVMRFLEESDDADDHPSAA